MTSTPKRQELPGGKLYVLGLPIGCDDDLTPRARRILTDVDGVLAEDTRVLAGRLKRLGLPEKRLVRSDAHHAHAGAALDGLARGEIWALVSDAGTPGLSDPGAEVVAAVREAGFEVVPVPGASAFVALASVSGLVWEELGFLGFLPRKSAEKIQRLKSTSADVVAFYESPERIEATLADLEQHEELWDRMVLGKELTKTFERIVVGTPGQVLAVLRNLQDETVWRGEWCGLLKKRPLPVVARGVDWERMLEALLAEGVSPSRAVDRVRQVWADVGPEEIPSKRLIYDTALKMNQKK